MPTMKLNELKEAERIKISLLKKDMLKGDFKIDKESKVILAMINVRINELYAISRLVKEDE